MSKKIVLTGAGGMLAQDLAAILQTGADLIPIHEEELDICDAAAVHAALDRLRPDVVVNCAAYTQVDACETEQEKAFAVNAGGVEHLARACRHAGSLLVHISTDYVFDGAKLAAYTESDTPRPISIYGKSKLAGERHVRELLERYVIIRSSWLYGAGGNNFISTIMRLARDKKELTIVDDQRGSPTWTRDLSRAIQTLLDGSPQGIYHVSNQGHCTWYDYARRIVELAGLGLTLRPITTDELNRPARRPAYSVLDCTRFTGETGVVLRNWEAALEEYITHEVREV